MSETSTAGRSPCDHDLDDSHWVDFGRDFYAPVSFSDIPKSDGRRIWIGWMNNWETHNLPTKPWRSAMSIPRHLTLKRFGEQLKLIQTPVAELKSLRGSQLSKNQMVIDGEVLIDRARERFEIKATFDLKDATEFGFKLRTGAGEETVVGFDAKKNQLFVDRTNSGESAFHPNFAGKHSGPLSVSDGKVKIHLFVDSSSIEVFGNQGETVITNRVFPDPMSQGLQVYANGGRVVVDFDLWELKSIWPN